MALYRSALIKESRRNGEEEVRRNEEKNSLPGRLRLLPPMSLYIVLIILLPVVLGDLTGLEPLPYSSHSLGHSVGKSWRRHNSHDRHWSGYHLDESVPRDLSSNPSDRPNRHHKSWLQRIEMIDETVNDHARGSLKRLKSERFDAHRNKTEKNWEEVRLTRDRRTVNWSPNSINAGSNYNPMVGFLYLSVANEFSICNITIGITMDKDGNSVLSLRNHKASSCLNTIEHSLLHPVQGYKVVGCDSHKKEGGMQLHIGCRSTTDSMKLPEVNISN